MLQVAKNMVSPFTGGKVTLNWEWREVDFRKDKYHVMFPYYKCMDTCEQFTTTESDGVWMAQVHNRYCHKFGIPYTDEIVALRKKYGISALKMSIILGFGENQWRRYEQEEIPSLSNGKMIRSIMNPNVFLDLVESSKGLLTDKEYNKIKAKVNEVIDGSTELCIRNYEIGRIFSCARSEENGFAPLSFVRLKNIMLYVLNRCGETFCTKMNKMLFYIDFLSYRENGTAMTGLAYRAIDYGPVPEHWERVYSQFDEVVQEPRYFTDFEGYVLTPFAKADVSIFTKEELEVLDAVCDRFKNVSSKEISSLSHEERGWLDCHEKHARIPFSTAFDLKAI